MCGISNGISSSSKKRRQQQVIDIITEAATQEGVNMENYLIEKLKNPQTIVSLSLPAISSAIQSNFSEIKSESEKKGVSVLESAQFGLGFLDLASDIQENCKHNQFRSTLLSYAERYVSSNSFVSKFGVSISNARKNKTKSINSDNDILQS